jgi:hypothetical protein
MFELGKFKASSSAMASFAESIDWIEYGEQFVLNLKDGSNSSILPKWVDDKRRKFSKSKVILTDRNSSLTSSINREGYKGGKSMPSIMRASWRDGAESSDMKLFKNMVEPE